MPRIKPTQAVSPMVRGSDGTALDLESWAHSYARNGDGTMQYDQVTDGTNSWRKTYSYTAGKITSETAWVKQ